jgi:serine/threonine-protein kinase
MPRPGAANVNASDELLGRLLNELTEQLRAHGKADVEALANQHPDLAVELRELWAAAQIAEELARPSLHSQITLESGAATSLSAPPAPIPRQFGDYKLLEELGRGGMGVVYKARQRNPERTVALKMILRGNLASASDLARFRAEAQSAARLEGHPNIVAVHEVGECDGQPYFSMQFVEGTTLARLVSRGPLPPLEAACYLAAVARAVHYAHQNGILHRDLKPSNVLLAAPRSGVRGQGPGARKEKDDARSLPDPCTLTPDPFLPMITDFGLAKRVESGPGVTQTGAIVGTPSYMAPEQAASNRGPLGPTSDVYGLGAILYEMLTGRPPFQAATPLDTIMLVLEQEVVAPRLLNPKVPRELEMICLKCLQKPMALRYSTAGQLADDLEAFQRGEPISARPMSVVYFFGRMLGETHHAAVLENWGLLWMWHSLALVILCSATNILYLAGVETVWPYLGLWVVGMGVWASIFWALRRRAGPVTFVERQIAHVWAASTLGSISLFGVEILLGLKVLTLSPVLAVIGGMVFLVKGGMLSGWFYLAAAASFVTAALMAIFPSVGLFLFGFVSAASFFLPGLKYYRQRVRSLPATGSSMR